MELHVRIAGANRRAKRGRAASLVSPPATRRSCQTLREEWEPKVGVAVREHTYQAHEDAVGIVQRRGWTHLA